MWPLPLRLLLVLTALVGVVGCSGSGYARPESQLPEPAPRVIFGPEDLERWVEDGQYIFSCEGPCGVGLPEADRYWKPSPAQVSEFVEAIETVTGDERYGIQFVGLERDGRLLIAANGYCFEPYPSDEGWVVAFDGGSCFFQAIFDLETEEMVGFGYNGVA